MEWPSTAAAVAFLAAYASPIIDTSLPGWLVSLCQVVTWATWGLFAVDYLVRGRAHRDRAAFFRRNIFDLLVLGRRTDVPIR